MTQIDHVSNEMINDPALENVLDEGLDSKENDIAMQAQLTTFNRESNILKVGPDSLLIDDSSKKINKSKWVNYLNNFRPNMKVRWQKITILLFLLTTVQFIFAGYTVITVLFIKDIKLDIGLLTLIRSLITCMCSFLLAILFEGNFSLYQYNSKTLYYFLTVGFVYAAGSPVLFQIVVELTTATFSVILQQLLPIFSFILSLIFKVEAPPNLKDICFIAKMVGISVCVVSATAISALNFTVPAKEIAWSNWVIGTIVALLDYLLMSLYLVLQAKIIFCSQDHPLAKKPFTLNFLTSFYGTVVYVPFCGIYFFLAPIDFELTLNSSVAILYSGIVLTCIGYALLVLCVKWSTPLVSSCLFSVETVTSMIMLRFFTDEKMTVIQYVISAGVIGGALVAVLSPLFDRFNKKKEHINHSI